MAIGSGLGSQVGFSAETVYGTFVAPTKFVRAKSFDVSRDQERVQGEGLAAGQLGPLGAHYVETTEAASAKLECDVQSKGLGLLLQAITGGTSTSTVLSGSVYTQVHTLGDNFGKSLSFQAGVPFRGGTVAVHSASGCKVTSAEFSCSANSILSLNVDLDAQKFDDSKTLAVASYLSTNVFHGKQMTVKVGTFGSETTLAGVKDWSQTWQRNMDTADYTAGGSGLKAEPVLNDNYEISGNLTVDWLSKSAIQDLVISNTPKSLVVEFVGPIIAAANAETIRFTLPSVYFSGDMQGVRGAEALSNQWSYMWKYDGTNLPKIEVITSDTAL